MSWRIPHLESQISAARRRGVSLLEVLFSIGIVAVGLLGIMVLLPVAGSRVAHGVVADMGDRVGRSAIRQFNVQLMRQPKNMWTWYDLSSSPPSYVSVTPSPGISYCIDPLCVGTLVDGARYTLAVGDYPSFQPGYFPWFDPNLFAGPRMYRISLRPTTVGVPSGGMTKPQAEQAFLYQDDLTVSLPDDRTLLPIQNFGTGSVKRQYEGRFSWLATLTPMGPLASDLYVLSIVVLHRRDLDMTHPVALPGNEEPENERLVNVTFLDPMALAGGEVTLTTRDNTRPAKDLQLGQGQWVMLMGADATHSVFKWYRVLAVEPEPRGTGPYQRNVTLFGQDWDFTQMTTPPGTQALLMSGVVAVYEKTIRLETSSLWTVQ
jgi:hypothetical protein